MEGLPVKATPSAPHDTRREKKRTTIPETDDEPLEAGLPPPD